MSKQKINKKNRNILWFKDIDLGDLALVGGKNSSLGELIKLKGVKVPNGFAITTAAYDQFMEPIRAQILEDIETVRKDGCNDMVLLDKISTRIRQTIEGRHLDRGFEIGDRR